MNRPCPRFRATIAAGGLTVFFATGLGASVVVAPRLAAAADPREEAKLLTQRAATEFKLAHFQEALDLYTQAYERYPAPALLFNLGQCNKNLGHNERALFFFQGYVRDKPDAPNRPAVEILVADLTKQVAAARASAAAAEAERVKVAELQAEKAAAEARAAEEAVRNAPPPPTHRRPALTVTGVVLGGVGLVLLGTGAYFGEHASSQSKALSQLSTSGGVWSPYEQSVYGNGQSSATAATALFVAGGVLVATGVTFVIFGLQKLPGAAVTVGVAPLRGGSSFELAGHF